MGGRQHLRRVGALVVVFACGERVDDPRADGRDAGAILAPDARPAPDARSAPDADVLDASAADAEPYPDAQTARPDSGPPASIRAWFAGDPDDAPNRASGPAAILMGGGTDVDDAYRWAARRSPNGDAVVLRASGADGYQDYLFSEIGGFDSVETLLFEDRAAASDLWVLDRVRNAELLYFAGGDQTRYLELWSGTPLADAVREAWARGATVGGTSAGQMLLGDVVFSAERGSVVSADVLRDPLHPDVTLADGPFGLAPLEGVVLDSHFRERDRYGRLVVFLVRSSAALAIGVDEATALLVDATGRAEVVGRGAAYAIRVVSAGPLASPLDDVELESTALIAGETLTLPSGASSVPRHTVRVTNGALVPTNPYR